MPNYTKPRYFSHDLDAYFDPKMLQLSSKFGQMGKGIWWDLVPILYGQRDQRLPRKSIVDIVLSLAAVGSEFVDEFKGTHWSRERVEKWVEYCLEIGLLVENEDSIWSESVLSRMQKMSEVSEMRRKAGEKGGAVTRSYKNGEAIAEHLLSKRQASAKQVLSTCPARPTRQVPGNIKDSIGKNIKEREDPPSEGKSAHACEDAPASPPPVADAPAPHTQENIPAVKSSKMLAPLGVQKIRLTRPDLEGLIAEFGRDCTKHYLCICDDWLLSRGHDMTNYAAFVRKWIREDKVKCSGFFTQKHKTALDSVEINRQTVQSIVAGMSIVKGGL